MRIARLHLRYGHLVDEVLEFPPDRSLHIVLGANEAGKSTALEAVADGLFGFEHRTSRDFLHPADTLRVGLTLRGADGREASFTRRKGRRDTLLDGAGLNGAGGALPDNALAPFLGGVGRRRFEQVFGLNAEQLRAGGAAILLAEGEAGATILQAQTGLKGLREAVQRLDDEAKSLHGDGRGVRLISAAAKLVREKRLLMADRSLSGPGFQAAQAELAALDGRRREIEAETLDLRAEQGLRQRTRRTAPVRGALLQAGQELAALGQPPALPPDAAAQLQAASAAIEVAGRELARDQARAGQVRDALERLAVDAAVLAEADAIAAIAGDRSRIEEMRRDRLDQMVIAEQQQRAMDQAGARLGVADRGGALSARIPGAVARRAAERLMTEHDKQSGARALAMRTRDDAVKELAAADRACAGMDAPQGGEALRDAVEAAKQEGRIDEALAKAAAADADAAAEAAAALAGLPLWSGTAEALAASPPPLEAEALRLAKAIEAAQAAMDSATRTLAAHDQKLAETAAALQGAAAAGTLPTMEAVVAVRTRRDMAWRLVRRQHVAGGPPPSDAELAAVGAAASMPDALGQLLREADELADRRLSEAVRVEAWERLRETEARDRALRTGFAAAAETARAGISDAEAAWGSAWAPAGVRPLDPAAMRDWVARRAALLAAVRAAGQARRALGQEQERHARVLGRLAALLPGVVAGGSVALMQREATRRLAALDAAAKALGAAQTEVAAARGRVQAAEDALGAIDAALEAWRGRWREAAAALGLASDAPVEDGAEALALWTLIEKHAGEWAGAADRIARMDVSLTAHDAGLAGLAGRLGAPVSDGLAAGLAARLEAAQAARAERMRLEAEQHGLAAAIAGHERAIERAEAGLAALRRLAGAVDDAALAAAIERSAAHVALTATVQERTAELHRLDDGKTVAELDREAAEMDIDAIPGRLAAIEARLGELEAERIELGGKQADGRAAVQRMEAGQDVAGPAQAVQDLLAEIDEGAHRYMRLRVAHALLQGGIDRYRRSQQGPLLEKAGAYFEALTGGRYHRLELDEGDKGEPVIVAARPDGTHCRAEHLSEGTRDQLFLALRLASIAIEAAGSEPLPLIADDLLVNFDDRRAAAALRVLADFGATTQVILFTHHDHLAAMADLSVASLHYLPGALALG